MPDSHSLAFFLILGILASVLLAAGLVMMKSRGAALPPARGAGALRAIFAWIRDPVWIGGLAVETTGYALYVIALAGAPISLLAVMMQGGIALFVLFATVFLHERARAGEWTGIAGIIAAMVMVSLSLRDGAPAGAANSAALAVISIVAVAAAAAAPLSFKLRNSGAAFAIASGISFGLGSLYTKALADAFVAHADGTLIGRLFANPWLYPAVAANIAGLVMLQNAFHRARGIVVMPLSSACSNMVPILGGMIAFGERLPPDPFAAAMRIAAFALTIGAGALLAVGQDSSSA